jgi:hypothetical protein
MNVRVGALQGALMGFSVRLLAWRSGAFALMREAEALKKREAS